MLSYDDTKVVGFLTLYECLVSDASEHLGVNEIVELSGAKLSKNLLKRGLEELAGSGYVRNDIDLYDENIGNGSWTLLAKGINHAERLKRDGVSLDVFQSINDDDMVYPEPVIEEIRQEELWEPLPVDRVSAEFIDALKTSEHAEKVIREDNGFAATHPEIRDSIVWTLGAAVNRLREGLITAGQIKSMLIAPFRKVSSLFTEGLLKEACERAVEKLLALF